VLLAKTIHITAVLEKRLTKRGSNCTAVVTALVALKDTLPDSQAVAELRNLPDAAPEILDQDQEEPLIRFGPDCAKGSTWNDPSS